VFSRSGIPTDHPVESATSGGRYASPVVAGHFGPAQKTATPPVKARRAGCGSLTTTSLALSGQIGHSIQFQDYFGTSGVRRKTRLVDLAPDAGSSTTTAVPSARTLLGGRANRLWELGIRVCFPPLNTAPLRKGKPMSISPFRGLAIVLATGALSSAAYGIEYSFPGSNCVSSGGFADVYAAGAFIQNTSVQARNVECPILRAPPDDSDVAAPRMQVFDTHASQDITCYVRSCAADNSSCDFSAVESSSSTGPAPLSFASVDGDTNGFALFTCFLPGATAMGNSRVVSYRWTD
jgi:hypothetical protein